MNKKLAEAYGARVSAGVEKVGEAQVMRISITCIADRFAFDGDGAVTECVKLLCEPFLPPHVETARSTRRMSSGRNGCCLSA